MIRAPEPVSAPAAVLADGTPTYAPPGELLRSADEWVLCHLCGRWFHSLAPAHLGRAHGLTADAYRELIGLNQRTQLRSMRMVYRQRRVMRRLLRTDARIQRALLDAQARAIAGERSEDLRRGHQYRLQRTLEVRDPAMRASQTARRAAARQRSERVRELGFASERAYLRDRYLRRDYSMQQIAREWRVGPAMVLAGLARSGIQVPSPVTRAAATKRRRIMAQLRTECPPGETRSWEEWFRDLKRQGITQVEMARLSGRSIGWVRHRLALLRSAPP